MASGIDPNLKPTKPAAQPAAQPAAAKPVAAAPVAKPAAPAAPKPAAPAAAASPPAEPAQQERGPSFAGTLLRTTPAWAISMLVHIIALLAMALMVTPPQEKEKPRLITSSAAEPDDNLEDAIEDVPEVKPTDLPTVSDVTVPTDVAVVEDVKVVSDANDVDAAPIAVELTDFGAQTAPASDMLAQIGAVGGTGGGFGGRANTKQMAAQNGGGADTEDAVEAALAWFIEHQMPDGGWSFDLKACPNCQGKCGNSGEGEMLQDRLAPTTLALLPMLGKGYTHTAGPYKGQIERGLAFLIGLVNQTKGKLYKAGAGHGGMYGQGLAGIVLAESYAMTQDQRLAVPAQVVLNSIMECQNPVNGGWQYQPKKGGDTSVLGWQLMALKSGHMAYLQVNPLTVKKASEFLDSVQGDEVGATYGYTSPGNGPGTTAAGLLCRMYLGWKKDNPGIQKGTAALAKGKPSGTLYTSYYATQVLHHMEGDMWLSWNEKMKALLLPAQVKSGHEKGSWYTGVDKDGGAKRAGRIYTTSLATMMLEAYYRHMPIYRNQSVGEEFKE